MVRSLLPLVYRQIIISTEMGPNFLTAVSEMYVQKAPSQMFDGDLNTPLNL